MKKLKILVIGGGGREHALVWSMAHSQNVEKIWCAPGNPGISVFAECVNIDVTDLQAFVDFARQNDVDLCIAGPEAPLVAGIGDVFAENGLRVFGPDRAAAQLEGSKVFAKEFMIRHGIPTAYGRAFDDVDQACAYTRSLKAPPVVKADGLAAGKGVLLPENIEEAIKAVRMIMEDRQFGDAGRRVLLEERLEGEEASILALSDGRHVLTLASSQDHKRIFDGDMGPNTGGMGAYSPAPVVTPFVMEKVIKTILEPVIAGMAEEGHPYRGLLYAGIMVDDSGNPNVVEFNCRFGDPETQAVLPRLDSDIVPAMICCADGHGLEKETIRWKPQTCVAVVAASKGYPGKYEKGKIITGLDQAGELVFHAGTAKIGDDLVTAGGRVLAVSALGDDAGQAVNKAYRAMNKVKFDGMQYRKDIAHRAVERE